MDKPRIEIVYCPRCNWLLRSAWLAQELLMTFDHVLAEVALVPATEAGTFRITMAGEILWERGTEGGFPQVKELKRRVRDLLDPELPLGHIDR